METTEKPTGLRPEDIIGGVVTSGIIGGGIGGITSAIAGGMGLAIGGTAVAVTMAPVIIAGAVIGIVSWGIHGLFNMGRPPHPGTVPTIQPSIQVSRSKPQEVERKEV